MKKLIFTISILYLTLCTLASARCSDVKIDHSNNIYFYMLQLDRGASTSLPWTYSADHGGLDECKTFTRLGGQSIKKYMKGSKGWAGYAILHKKVIGKQEFCNSNGPYSTYGLGSAALRFCDTKTNETYGVKNLSDYELCLSALSTNGSEWSSREKYTNEISNRNLDMQTCRGYKFDRTDNKLIFIDSSTPKKIDSNQSVNTSSTQIDNSASIDSNAPLNRLKDLKELLNDGLISQEQYDNKSTEILNDL